MQLSFLDRHKEHQHEASHLHLDSSKFYLSYPAKSKYEFDNSIVTKKAFFEELTMYLGFGFEGKNENEICAENELPAQARDLFLFSDKIKEKLVHVLGSSTVAIKQQHMIGYLMELAYDLLLCPSDNVSGSAGFEPFLGRY